MKKQFLIRAKITLKDNRIILAVLFGWFLAGFVVFSALGAPLCHALLASLLLKEVTGDFARAYDAWTEAVIFGVAFSFLFQNVIERFNPERSCRMLARELTDHVVVVGFTNLGKRLVNHYRQQGIPYCLIEKNADKVDELLRAGEAIVVDDAREMDALTDASIAAAKAVLIASNNLDTALLVTKRARDMNATCLIVTRCFHDEFVEIIESLGANEVISSSKNAFDDILGKMARKTSDED